MIRDARQIEPGAELTGTIAIIGGGAAGITLAIELAKRFKDVLVLESGGLEFEQDTQDLYNGPVLGHDRTDLASSRLRFLGGSTNHWNGQCAPFDPVDFERIPGKPHSGWPFTSDALSSFYERAYDYCELGPYRASPVVLERNWPTGRQLVESGEFELTEFRYSPPTRFGTRYRSDLQASDRINIYLHANVTNISVTDGGRSISFVQFQTLAGGRHTVKASAFILCCGGIENPRILLNCTDFFPAGIGNRHDLVGRYFSDHFIVDAGTIMPKGEVGDFQPFIYHRDGIARIRAGLKNSAQTVRKPGRLGCSVILEPEFERNERLLSAGRTPAYAAFQQLVRYARLGEFPRGLGERECTILDNTSAVGTTLYHRTVEALWRKPALKSIGVWLEGEQAPNPDSRIVLVGDVDSLGMRRVGLNWRITADDRANLYRTLMALAQELGAAGLGRVVTPIDAEGDLSFINTGWHHMGTTRMHNDPQQGVVDRDCKVHGLENLFIAGSSVFPTGGRANPTLTIVALAVRLADHLKQTVRV